MTIVKSIAAPHQDTIHDVKCWPEYFGLIEFGFKTFEVRKNDRDYQVNDYLRLREWDPKTKEYTGNKTDRRIKYIMFGDQFGVQKGYVVMQLEETVLGPIEESIKY